MYYSKTFDLISRSPAAKVCLLSQNNSAVRNQKAVLFYFTSKQMLPFVVRVPLLNSLDLFNDTMCVQAH